MSGRWRSSPGCLRALPMVKIPRDSALTVEGIPNASASAYWAATAWRACYLLHTCYISLYIYLPTFVLTYYICNMLYIVQLPLPPPPPCKVAPSPRTRTRVAAGMCLFSYQKIVPAEPNPSLFFPGNTKFHSVCVCVCTVVLRA